MYVHTHIRTEGSTFVRTYPRTQVRMENRKTICSGIIQCMGHKNVCLGLPYPT